MSTQMVPMHSPEQPQVSNRAAIAPARFVSFGTFYLDLKKEELFKDGTRVKLQGKVYQALLALLQKPGEIVTREELRGQLWPSDTHVNYDANVNTTVNKLRLVLGDSPEQPAFVETIPRKGYSFIAKVEYADQPVILSVPKPAEELLPVGAVHERADGKASFFRTVILSRWFTAGIVTLEDMVEEIVGEIHDEHEPERDFHEEPDGSYVVSGSFDLGRLEDLVGFRPQEGTESTTVGGLVTEWLGHVPTVGEEAERDGIEIKVLASNNLRVDQVRVAKAAKNEA